MVLHFLKIMLASVWSRSLGCAPDGRRWDRRLRGCLSRVGKPGEELVGKVFAGGQEPRQCSVKSVTHSEVTP